MHIQSYQIHNVLNVYRQQLSQGKTNQPSDRTDGDIKTDSVTISAKGNNQSIMEKVAESVLKKITNIDPNSNFGQEMLKQTQNLNKAYHRVEKENQFVFNTIANNNQKETRSIAVDNSHILMSRLDELARASITSDNEKDKSSSAAKATAERTD
jgi:hypothetical protein